jgi:hypothetical protein
MDRPRSNAAAPSSDPEPVSVTDHLRNVRYCEVIPVTRRGIRLTSWVYNTLGLNDCPAAEWDALTEEQVNEAYGSVAAKLNGPRYWVLDQIAAAGSSTTGETFDFGGIEMALRATLDSRVGQDTVGDAFYVPNEVQRDTVYTYYAGSEVYELTDTEGAVYVMQSYSQIVDTDLTIEQLPALGGVLDLPAGWTYSARVLTADLVLAAEGTAYVINDNLYNSYQRRT